MTLSVRHAEEPDRRDTIQVPGGKSAFFIARLLSGYQLRDALKSGHVVRVQSARRSHLRSGKLAHLTRSFFDRRAQLLPSAPAAV